MGIDNVVMLLKIMSEHDPPTKVQTFIHLLIHLSIYPVNKEPYQRKMEKNCFLSSAIKLRSVLSQGERTQKPLPRTLILSKCSESLQGNNRI